MINATNRRPLMLLAFFSITLVHLPLWAQENGASIRPIRDALQAGQFDQAETLAQSLANGGGDHADEARYLHALSLQLQQLHGPAVDAADQLLQNHPKSQWVHKAAFLKVRSLLKLRQFDAAQSILDAQAHRLLSADRKEEIANVLIAFADALATEPDPKDPGAPAADYAKAAQLYQRVREMEVDRDVLDSVSYKQAFVTQQSGNENAAKQLYEQYLQQFDPDWMGPVGSATRMRGQKRDNPPPAGAHILDARYRLGKALLAMNHFPQARQEWQDLETLIRSRGAGDEDERAPLNKRIADTSWQIVRSYNMPQTIDDPDVAVKAARSFLQSHPQHAYAVEAAWLIAQTYAMHGRADEAVAALEQFRAGANFQLPEGEAATKVLKRHGKSPAELKDEWEKLALYQIGTLRYQQKLYAQAIEQFNLYTNRYPNGPQWADAQRMVINCQFSLATDAVATREYDRARQLINDFLTKNPLDGRASQLLFVLGQMHASEADLLREAEGATPLVRGGYERAIAEWEKLISKYPNTEPSSLALYRTGLLYEEQLDDLPRALETYRRVTFGSWASHARHRISQMTEKQLVIKTERKFRTNEQALVQVDSRNIEKLTVRQYHLDLEDYFRKTHSASGVENLDIALIEPDKTWEIEIPEYEKYKQSTQQVQVPFDADRPGVCILHIGEDDLEATTLVIRSDIDLVMRSSREELLVFVQNMRTGEPAPNVRVLVSDAQQVFVTGTTGGDGVLRSTEKKIKDAGELRLFANLDGHVASHGLSLHGISVPTQLMRKSYLYTERPAYQPGQNVFVKGIVRTVENGSYVAPAGAEYVVRVQDGSGRLVYESTLALSAFGTFDISFTLDEQAPSGNYNITTHPAKEPQLADTATFLVQPFQLQKMKLEFDFPRLVYHRGDKVTGTLRASYYWGQPVVERPVRYALPDGTQHTEQTDAKGEIAIEFDTSGMQGGAIMGFSATIEGENVATQEMLWLPQLGFEAVAELQREVVLAGEPFDLRVTTRTPDGKPIARRMTVTVLRREVQAVEPVLAATPWIQPPAAQTADVTIEEHVVQTEEATGKGTLRLVLGKGGQYTLRIAGEDQFGQIVSTTESVMISDASDATKLRMFSESSQLKVGEQATVRLHSRLANRTLALVTFEGDRIISHRIVPLEPGHNDVVFQVDHEHFPNFTLASTAMESQNLHAAVHPFDVARQLQVTVKPVGDVVLPGQETEAEVIVTDQLGRPVQAELSLAVVNEALFAMFPDNTPPIVEFFESDAKRSADFRVASTNAFRYDGTTVKVLKVIQQELERLAEQEQQGLLAPPARPAAPNMMGRRNQRGAQGGIAPSSEMMDMDTNEDSVRLLQSKREFGNAESRFRSGGGFGGGGFGAEGLRTKTLEGSSSFFAQSDFSDEKKLGDDGRASARREMPSDGYWLATIVTNEDGKATVKLPMPETTTQWRLTARGVTRETLVGQTTANVVTRKDFFVELKMPRTVTEGDEIRIVTRVHNLTDYQGKANLVLTISSGEQKFTNLRRSITVKPNVATEVVLDPIQLAQAGELDVTVSVQADEDAAMADAMTRSLKVHPWGMEYAAHRGGIATNSMMTSLRLPEGITYQSKWLMITLGADVHEQLIRMAMGPRYVRPLPVKAGAARLHPPTIAPWGLLAGSELLAATRGLHYAQNVNATEVDRQALTKRAQGLISALTVSQLNDGGWAWGGSTQSDWAASAMSYWALGEAAKLGIPVDRNMVDKAQRYLQAQLQSVGANDYDVKAVLLHALSVRGDADFNLVNPLHRQRNNLSSAALAYTALTLANLDRKPMAVEVIAVLESQLRERKQTEQLSVYWDGRTRHVWLNDPIETSAVALLALMQVNPENPRIAQGIDYLLGSSGSRTWQPAKARGPAIAAIAEYYRAKKFAAEDFQVAITVNGQKVAEVKRDGEKPIAEISIPTEMLQNDNNIVRFDLTGRGQFAWTATMRGFSSEFKDVETLPTPRVYAHRFYHDQLTYRGVPIGVNSSSEVTQLESGQKTRVEVGISSVRGRTEPPYTIVEQHIPAGAVLVPDSLQGGFTHHEIQDNRIRVYFPPDRRAATFSYELVGFAPGEYRVAPTVIRDALDPESMHIGKPTKLTILKPGDKSIDPYVMNDVERYELGRRYFEDGRFIEAIAQLSPLFERRQQYREREVARMLLWIHTTEEHYNARRAVETFEVLSERHPELVVPFDKILAVGKAYRDIGELERSALVYAATIDSSFLRDSMVSAVLQDEGQLLGSIDYQQNLWWHYPDSPQVVSSHFTLSQQLYQNAGRANELAKSERLVKLQLPGVAERSEAPTRHTMLSEAIVLLQQFLTLYPTDPLADDAAFSMTNAYLDLKSYDDVVALSKAYHGQFKESDYASSFQYMTALGHFWKRSYEPALAAAKPVAEGKSKDRDFAQYILGQIYHAQGDAVQAMKWYETVNEIYSDAKEAIEYFRDKSIAMDEVHTFKPGEAVEFELRYRNIANANLQVYKVDLMKLYLREKNLSRIAAVNLAGIEPQSVEDVKLGDGQDYADKFRTVKLEKVTQEGAYLVIARGDDEFASGLVLITPLALEVQEDQASARVRVNVLDKSQGGRPAGVHVKVIGSQQGEFRSGDTDLRGLFVADAVLGNATVIARDANSRYAFYRGSTWLGGAPNEPAPQQRGETQTRFRQNMDEADYQNNLMLQNSVIQDSNYRQWDTLRRSGGKGVQIQQAK